MLAIALLLVGGLAYRAAAGLLGTEMIEAARPDPPLSSLPRIVGDWSGADVDISASELWIAHTVDYVNRRYKNNVTGRVANLYVGYTGRPRFMLAHRPTVCYPSSGWVHVSSETLSVAAPGAPHHVLANVFRKPSLAANQVLVLNYYILNGLRTVDENSFWSLASRDQDRRGGAGRYAAQVQVMVPIATSLDDARHVSVEFLEAVSADIRALLPGSSAPPADVAIDPDSQVGALP